MAGPHDGEVGTLPRQLAQLPGVLLHLGVASRNLPLHTATQSDHDSVLLVFPPTPARAPARFRWMGDRLEVRDRDLEAFPLVREGFAGEGFDAILPRHQGRKLRVETASEEEDGDCPTDSSDESYDSDSDEWQGSTLTDSDLGEMTDSEYDSESQGSTLIDSDNECDEELDDEDGEVGLGWVGLDSPEGPSFSSIERRNSAARKRRQYPRLHPSLPGNRLCTH